MKCVNEFFISKELKRKRERNKKIEEKMKTKIKT